MYKLSVFVLVTLASFASAVDEREWSLLMGHEKLFKDFCISSHDYVIDELKTMAQEKSSVLFKQFFGSANEIADEVLNVNRKAVVELTEQIATPEKPVSDAPLDEDEISRMIEKGKKEIQEKAGPAGLLPAVQAATMAVMSAFNSALFIRLAKARSQLDGFTLTKGILDHCEIAHSFADKLSAQMEDARSKILAENQDPEIQQSISKISLTQVHCFTTKNIVRLSAFCKIFKDGYKPFRKMLGLKYE